MPFGFTSSAVMASPKENRRRKWLRLLIIASALFVVVGFEIASAIPFLQRWIDQGDATIFSVNVGRDFLSLDRLDSLEWRAVAQRAVGAFAERDAALRHIITFFVALLSLALGYVVLRSMVDVVAGKKVKQLNGYPNRRADDNPGALFYFTLGEPVGSKDKPARGPTIDPRKYELGIDPSNTQFSITSRSPLEPEWEL